MKEPTIAAQKVIEFFDRVWHSPHELDAIDELMTEDYTITTAGTTVKGREAFKSWVAGFQKLLLNAKTENVALFTDEIGNKVVSQWVCSGRNNGLFGLAADQREVSFTGIAIWTLKGDRFSECWVERSAYELFQELNRKDASSDFV